jgi:DNA-binding transcriptional ArsR family regulator
METNDTEPLRGDMDLAAVASLIADPGRSRILLALLDGRSLAASVLADEAGLSAPATSAHLAKLREGGLITAERSGRHRYHRLAGDQVASAIEALAQLAPAQPIRSLRQHSRAAALRRARTCYDHLAGVLGVEVTGALLAHGALVSTDGTADTVRRPGDRFSTPLAQHPYALGPQAEPVFAGLGVHIGELSAGDSRRPLLRFCMDWSEQRHHLGGQLGAAVLSSMLEAGWLVRTDRRRVLRLTEHGERQLGERLALTVGSVA